MLRQDLHIHTRLSRCSKDEDQTPRNILVRARELGLDQICLTDHVWDQSVPGASDWYRDQNLEHIRKSLLEMPDDTGGVEAFFGCETEYLGGTSIGISGPAATELDFLLVPISHFHMLGYVRPRDLYTVDAITDLWLTRYRELLGLDLPWHKVAIAHPTDTCVLPLQLGFLRAVVKRPPTALFERTAELGVAVEINGGSLFEGEAAEINSVVYEMMRDCGCRFTLGSDAHDLASLNRIEASIRFAEALGLEDGDLMVLRH